MLFVARSHGWEPRVFEEHRPFESVVGRSRVRRFASSVLRPLLHRQNVLVTRYADGVVAGSNSDRTWIVRQHRYPLERVAAIAPGLGAEFLLSDAPPLDTGRLRRLLYVGQYAPVKAPDIVAAVMAAVLRRRPECTATWICAMGDHERARRLLPVDLSGRVEFLDWQPRSSLVRVYDLHGVFLFPSYFEGFGQTFLEAMARGMAVWASDVGGMSEVIEDGRTGYLFRRGAVTEMEESILDAMGQPTRAAEVGRAASARARKLTWEAAGEALERFLGNLEEMGALRRERTQG